MSASIVKEYQELMSMLTRFPKSSVPKGEIISPYLYEHLNKTWEEILPKYCIVHIQKNSTLKLVEHEVIRLYNSAVGLITYGRKDVIPFLFLDVSKVGKLSRLKRIAFELLPLPDELYSFDKTDEILNWIDKNYHRLSWDDKKKVFTLL